MQWVLTTAIVALLSSAPPRAASEPLDLLRAAEALMAEGAFEDATAKYLAFLEAAPRHPDVPRALNDAAVCFENLRQFDRALKLYETIAREHQRSALADRALFRVAVNAENSYAFEKALSAYQQLVTDYPQSEDREAALFNTGRLLNGLQRHAEAAEAYVRYAAEYPKSEDAPKNQFRAALLYEKLADHPKVVSTLEGFLRKFAADELAIDARRRIGESLQKLGKYADAKRAFIQAADEFDRRGLDPMQNPIGAEAAAISRFQLAEQDFRQFATVKLSGSGVMLEKSFAAKKQQVTDLNAAYQQVLKYKRAQWTLVSSFRQSLVMDRFVDAIAAHSLALGLPSTDELEASMRPGLSTSIRFGEKVVEDYASILDQMRTHNVDREWIDEVARSLGEACARCVVRGSPCKACRCKPADGGAPVAPCQ